MFALEFHGAHTKFIEESWAQAQRRLEIPSFKASLQFKDHISSEAGFWSTQFRIARFWSEAPQQSGTATWADVGSLILQNAHSGA